MGGGAGSALLRQKETSSKKLKIFQLEIIEKQTKLLCTKQNTSTLSKKAGMTMKRWKQLVFQESSCSRQTHSKTAMSCSLGASFSPATIFCNRLTLCVAEATGVMAASCSRRYFLPVRGVEGANDLFCQTEKLAHKSSQQNCFENLLDEHLLQNHSKDYSNTTSSLPAGLKIS